MTRNLRTRRAPRGLGVDEDERHRLERLGEMTAAELGEAIEQLIAQASAHHVRHMHLTLSHVGSCGPHAPSHDAWYSETRDALAAELSVRLAGTGLALDGPDRNGADLLILRAVTEPTSPSPAQQDTCRAPRPGRRAAPR